MKKILSSSFTRPADTTAYGSGDLVANSTTAGSVTPIRLNAIKSPKGGIGKVSRVRLQKSGTGVTNAAFRVHFYSASPTPANGDNGAWSTTHAGYFGSVDVTIDKAFTDGAAGVGAPAAGAEPVVKTAANVREVFALIEARGAYTPANAEVFTLTVEAEGD